MILKHEMLQQVQDLYTYVAPTVRVYEKTGVLADRMYRQGGYTGAKEAWHLAEVLGKSCSMQQGMIKNKGCEGVCRWVQRCDKA